MGISAMMIWLALAGGDGQARPTGPAESRSFMPIVASSSEIRETVNSEGRRTSCQVILNEEEVVRPEICEGDQRNVDEALKLISADEKARAFTLFTIEAQNYDSLPPARLPDLAGATIIRDFEVLFTIRPDGMVEHCRIKEDGRTGPMDDGFPACANDMPFRYFQKPAGVTTTEGRWRYIRAIRPSEKPGSSSPRSGRGE